MSQTGKRKKKTIEVLPLEHKRVLSFKTTKERYLAFYNRVMRYAKKITLVFIKAITSTLFSYEVVVEY